MSIERYVELVPADVTGLIQLPIERSSGNYLLFQSALANVTITLIGDGTREVFANVNGGIYVRRVKPWTNLRIDGPIGTQVIYFVGSTNVEADETDIRQQVAVLAGVSATADQPAAAMSNLAPVNVGAGAVAAIVPANFGRRRVTLCVDPAAGNNIFVRMSAASNDLMPMQPGVTYQFNGFYGIWGRNPGAAGVNVYILEES